VEDEESIDDAVDKLDKARTKTNFGIGEGNKLEVVESKSNGMFGYKNAIKYHDEQITRGLVIPSLVMGIEETGARALGETHFDLFVWRIQSLQKELANVVQNQINRLININFGEQEIYPTLKFPPLVSKDKGILTDMIVKMIEKGVISPDEKWIRPFLEIPQDIYYNDKKSMDVPDDTKPIDEENRSYELVLRLGKLIGTNNYEDTLSFFENLRSE
jgi:phage gp29-like protein